jgi:hypothetical protein
MAIPGLDTFVQNIGSGVSQVTGQVTGAINQVTGAVNQVTGAVGQVTGAVGQIGNQVTGAINSVTSGITGAINNIGSALRSVNLPRGGEVKTDAGGAQVSFGASDVNNDWRVRLSIPPLPEFEKSPVLAPLKVLGNMVFPYTPTIQLSHTANYNEVGVTHQNYQFMAYENSRADNIIITAPFNVEDGQQAKYWIAALHYFRSVTKMFSGDDQDAGNPPVIVKLNGYGEYVFNNVPVIVKSFSFDLPQDADYIPADANLLAGIPGIGGFLGAGVKTSRVPTKSTLSVTLQPIYSRTAARYFSLTEFVNGGYVSTGGYV